MIKRSSSVTIPISMTVSGLTPSGYVSLNGSTFVSLTQPISAISDGWYKVPLTAAETSAEAIGLRITASGVSDYELTLITEGDYTAARAEFLDVAVSSRLASAGYTTPPTEAQIWDYTVAIESPGSVGEYMNAVYSKVNTNLNAKITSRAGSANDANIVAIKADTATLTGRLTNTRATNLDKLDANISSRASSSIVSTIATNLDTTVSSRLASTNYTAPDNSTITSINTKTSGLNFTGTDIKATLDSETVTLASGTHTGAVIPTVTSVTNQVNIPSVAVSSIGANLINSTVAPNLDATISSRASSSIVSTIATNLDTTISSRMATFSYTAPDNANILLIKTTTDALTGRLTSTRAGYLDNLDVAISSRAASSQVNSIPTNPLLTNDARLNNLDATISSRLATTGYVPLESVAAVRVSSIDVGLITSVVAPNLDVSVSSRLGSAGYTAPDNATLMIAKTNTDTLTGRLTDTRAANIDNLDATVTSRASSSIVSTIATNLDATISSRLASADYTPSVSIGSVNVTSISNGVITAAVAPNLDVAISSRLASTDYTPGGVVSIDAVRVSAIDAGLITSVVAPNLNASITSRASTGSVAAIPTNPLLTTDARLNNLDATITSRASSATLANVPTNPLLATDSRLNNIDTTISSRLATTGYVPLAATAAVRVSSIDNGVVTSLVAPNLDVAVSSRLGSAGYTAPDNTSVANTLAQTQALTGRLTDQRATNLDKLDANITSRAGSAIDSTISTNLDAKVSTKMNTFTYTAPDNATITSINAKTSGLNFSGADIKATLDGEQVEVSSITDTALASIWNYTTRTLSNFGTLVTQVTTGVWNYVTRGLTAPVDITSNSDITSIKNNTDTLIIRVSAARASGLDFLDVAVSSRAPSSQVASIPTNPVLTTDTRLDYLDAPVSDAGASGIVASVTTMLEEYFDSKGINVLIYGGTHPRTDAPVLPRTTSPVINQDTDNNPLRR
jgi:hypothetical protein